MSSNFRKVSTAPRLTAEEARRQSRVSRLAFETLGKTGAAVAFLNAHNDELAGRPIDLAIGSVEGLARVEGMIATMPRG